MDFKQQFDKDFEEKIRKILPIDYYPGKLVGIESIKSFFHSKIKELLLKVKKCVPEEEFEYTPPTFTSAKKVIVKEFVNGFNSCRKEMLKNLEDKFGK